MVLMALEAAGDHTADAETAEAKALVWLAAQQDSDGGFPYQAGYGSDLDSTALVVQAIVATGGDPFAAGWTKDGNTPLGYLEANQDSDGGYGYQSDVSSPFTTSQVPLALLLQPYPMRATFSAGFTPAQEDRSILDSLLYLQAQQQPDGSIAGPAGSYADSELFAIAAAAAGYDPKALTAPSGVSVMDYLAANVATACPPPPADPQTSSGAGECGELIQAVVAAGEDPTAFSASDVDLVGRLGGYYDASTGAYGDGEAFTQALAIQGRVAAGAPPPPAAVTFLVNAQDSDGGWAYEDVKDDIANPYDTSDTNSTAMVLMALDAAGNHTRDASALAWLATQQDTDGGFPSQAGAGSDPDSTPLVVQAIVATGGDPVAAAWTLGGSTPLGYLESTQAADGGWAFPSPGSSPPPVPDPFTTSQVPLALERLAFPVPFGSRQWYVPGTKLGSPPPGSPSPSPTSPPPSSPPAGVITPSPTPIPTAPPTAVAQVQPASPAATPAAAMPAPTPLAVTTAPSPTAQASVGSSVRRAVDPSGGSPPALLIYGLVALAVALAVGAGRLALAVLR
jgi:prenyltransferase beta subunit